MGGNELNTTNMTATDFDKIIWRDALTFVDFFATWCGPCQMMHPVIDRFQEKMNGRVDVYKVDIDDRDMLEIGRIGYDHLANVLRELEQREQVGQR